LNINFLGQEDILSQRPPDLHFKVLRDGTGG
jgi:hypothetical protein